LHLGFSEHLDPFRLPWRNEMKLSPISYVTAGEEVQTDDAEDPRKAWW
jgi:hypothetical protein